MEDTIIIELEGGTVRAVRSLGTIREAAIWADGQPQRVLAVQSAAEAAIEQYVRDYRPCELAGAWHVLDDARDVVHMALTAAAEHCADYANALFVPIVARRPGDAAAQLAELRALSALHDATSKVLAAAQEALAGLREAMARAADDVEAAAGGGHHHGRLQLALA